MARIVYGVSGEGSGHSSRAREMIAFLESAGHEVKGVSYDRGYRNLAPDFDMLEIEGLHIATVENQVSVVKTFTRNLARLGEGRAKLRELNELFDAFEPHAVITDFEPMTAYIAAHRGLPLITVDNQHRMRFMSYPCPVHLKKDGLVTETVVRLIVPRPDVSLVTTFYFGDVKNDRTFLFPPILRREVLEKEPRDGDHVLVYFTQEYGDFLALLRSFPRERFLVYGMGREDVDGPFTYKPFSREGFLDDLASSKAVMSTAGFTLMTESLHLGKPLLALPMRGQFEQELNALLLDHLNYGRNGRKAGRTEIAEFLYRVPELAERLERYPRADNAAIQAKLGELLADDARLAREFRERRRRSEPAPGPQPGATADLEPGEDRGA